ncbi:MAG TPA: sulfatase-like hydrolase/transferase [Candidatus Krumholzibacteria bacterium]|jgi:hypothetical protein
MSRSRIIPELLTLAMFGACGQSADPEWSAVIDFPFPIEAADEATQAAGALGGVPHWLEGSWGIAEANGMWLLGRGGALVTALEPVETRLMIDAQTSAEIAQSGQKLDVFVNGHELASLDIPAWSPSKTTTFDLPPRWLAAAMDRIEFRPHMHQGDLDADAKQEFAVFLKQLRVEQHGLPEAKRATGGWADPARWRSVTMEAGSTPAPTEQTPDVLVIVLDAARPDHFGAYGYTRATTPFIDSLARDGIVLRKLHSVAPFTRCSMPSLLTGTPWFTHGMALSEDRLPSSIPTAAEFFGQAGYRRLALSESPHFSRAAATDRGFEEFWESWNHPDLEVLAREAEGDLLVRLFAELLAAHLDERPAFMMVHMIPPHVPYAPGKKFDLWAEDDPERSWKSVGPGELRAFGRGTSELSEPRRRRLVALYDGNLRRADDLVQKLIEHWQGLGRARPLRILISSDHGEALGEHGLFGHNFSLFTEMTQIPGVFWPREAFPELAAREGELWSNEDLLPLLLRNVGWQPSESVMLPRQFARIVRGSAEQRPVILMRSLLEIGARSDDTLWTFDRRRGPGVYDLRGDPEGSTNLFASGGQDFPEWVVGLGQLARASEIMASEPADSISSVDSDRLRALGYID